MCARRRTFFSCVAKKRRQKKATPLSASLRCASGNLRCSVPAGGCGTRFAQTVLADRAVRGNLPPPALLGPAPRGWGRSPAGLCCAWPAGAGAGAQSDFMNEIGLWRTVGERSVLSNKYRSSPCCRAQQGSSSRKHRGSGFASPLVLLPARGREQRNEVRAAWGCAYSSSSALAISTSSRSMASTGVAAAACS